MTPDNPSAESAQDIHVRLKSLFGVEPKYYLAVLYSLILLGVLFALLVLPGLTNPGTRVTVTSVPAGASVTWGGKHYGTTPLTVFLPEGRAALTVAKPGFQAQTKDFSSGSNLLFSLFLPKTDSLEIDLKPTSADSVARLATAEVGRWALAAPFNSEYRFPPLFTRLATDARASGWTEAQLKDFLLGLRAAVADPQMYLDYGRALGLWGLDAPVPEGLSTQFDLWAPLIGDPSDRLALWLLANQTKPVRNRETAEKSDWLQQKIAGFQASLKPALTATLGPAPSALRSPQGTFRGIGAATYLWSSDGAAFSLPIEAPYPLPVPVSTAAFWIADAEVTQGQFAAFVAANPKWAPAGRDALVTEGLADADYLAPWNDGKPTAVAEPVAAVSWYAAQAYVDWVNATGQVPSGKKAILPDDFQWEAAARAPGTTSLLNQGVWEWTASSWYPGQALVWTSAVPSDAQAYARSLKGGIQGAKGSVKAGDRAGWPAAGTTRNLGFRLALVGAP